MPKRITITAPCSSCKTPHSHDAAEPCDACKGHLCSACCKVRSVAKTTLYPDMTGFSARRVDNWEIANEQT